MRHPSGYNFGWDDDVKGAERLTVQQSNRLTADFKPQKTISNPKG